MKSKRYKKLPEKTNLEKPNSIKNLIPIIGITVSIINK